jgi:hypothetical protein
VSVGIETVNPGLARASVDCMRRGLLTDLANTPTQIVCGYRLYGPDLVRLLLSGKCRSKGKVLEPPLAIANDLMTCLVSGLNATPSPQGSLSALLQR